PRRGQESRSRGPAESAGRPGARTRRRGRLEPRALAAGAPAAGALAAGDAVRPGRWRTEGPPPAGPPSFAAGSPGEQDLPEVPVLLHPGMGGRCLVRRIDTVHDRPELPAFEARD